MASLDVKRFMTGPQAPGTEGTVMQQTMFRIKSPLVSLTFYCDVLGFKLIMYRDFQAYGFTVYFVAPIADLASIPEGENERWAYCMKTPGCIELTHNHGSESEEGRVYNVGNGDITGITTTAGSDAKIESKGGFGHIGITVPNVYRAFDRFKSLNVTIAKSPNAGGMKGLGFIKDPDGYMIEVLPQGVLVVEDVDCNGILSGGGEGYVDNSKK